MNKVNLSFTYNFDTSHLENENKSPKNDNNIPNVINTNTNNNNNDLNVVYTNSQSNIPSQNYIYTNSSYEVPTYQNLYTQSFNTNLYNNQNAYMVNSQYENQYSSQNQYENQYSQNQYTPQINYSQDQTLSQNVNSIPMMSQIPSSQTNLTNSNLSYAMNMGDTDDLKKLDVSQFKDFIPQDDKNDDYSNFDQKEPTLQNVISTFNLDCKLDLPKIQKKARNTEYHPKRFAALVMRIKTPQTTALIFSSGKVVVTGAKNEKESKLSCKKFARIIKKLDFPAQFKDFKIQNIVASCEVGYKVSLENLVSSEHANSCRYEPELFPGLIYKMIEPKVTLLIFVSGKIVITGAKDKNGVFQAFKNISPVLINFKK